MIDLSSLNSIHDELHSPQTIPQFPTKFVEANFLVASLKPAIFAPEK